MFKKWFSVMLRKKFPHRLWDSVIKWVMDIMQRTAGLEGSLNYCNSLEEVTGENHDIS